VDGHFFTVRRTGTREASLKKGGEKSQGQKTLGRAKMASLSGPMKKSTQGRKGGEKGKGLGRVAGAQLHPEKQGPRRDSCSNKEAKTLRLRKGEKFGRGGFVRKSWGDYRVKERKEKSWVKFLNRGIFEKGTMSSGKAVNTGKSLLGKDHSPCFGVGGGGFRGGGWLKPLQHPQVVRQ